jgi:hypothetical protein
VMKKLLWELLMDYTPLVSLAVSFEWLLAIIGN